MGRNQTKSLYVCQTCSYQSTNWIGKCPECFEWNTMVEEKNHQILNKSDIFARIGGEEFAILLSQVNCDDAYLLAEKIRKKIENDFITCEGQNIFVTTSIGISENRESDTEFENIFSRADMALYQAKNMGRNRTCYIELSNDDIHCPNPTVDNQVLNYSI